MAKRARAKTKSRSEAVTKRLCHFTVMNMEVLRVMINNDFKVFTFSWEKELLAAIIAIMDESQTSKCQQMRRKVF